MKPIKRLFQKRKNRKNKHSENYKHVDFQTSTDSTSYSSTTDNDNDTMAMMMDVEQATPTAGNVDEESNMEQSLQSKFDSSTFLTPLKSNVRREKGSSRSPKRNLMQQQFREIEEDDDYDDYDNYEDDNYNQEDQENYHPNKHNHNNDSSNNNSNDSSNNNMEQYPQEEYTFESLIEDIATCQQTHTEKPARALKTLFTLSDDNPSNEENRIGMVREVSGKLVPTLLTFLTRIQDELSSEKYLTLLVLNNISIPAENKRIIALDCGGARILGRLLCQDPSCHIISIILANLTYCSDFDLRNELMERTNDSDIDLIPALIYSFKIATLTPEEYSLFGSRLDPTSHDGSPRDYLDSLSSVEQSVALSNSAIYKNTEAEIGKLIDLDDHVDNPEKILEEEGEEQEEDSLQTGFEEFNPKNIMHRETARWCVCTLRNLTRSPQNEAALHAILDCGALPLMLKVLSVRNPFENDENKLDSYQQYRQGSLIHKASGGAVGAATGVVPSAVSPSSPASSSSSQQSQNHVYHWDENSIQSTALYILLDLTLNSSTMAVFNRKRSDVLFVLSRIGEFSSCAANDLAEMREMESQKDLQCLKARMALALFLGSDDQVGQQSSDIIQDRSDGKEVINQNNDLHLMMMKGSETSLIVELLANTLHGRGKDGPGGYRPSTFNPKMVLYAIRCLVANKLNVKTFHVTRGVQINSLLLKAIALYSFTEDSIIDEDAAEDACFTLYLMSGLGFMGPFLSGISNVTLFSKILLYYFRKQTNMTGAGSHATRQLLLRASSLNFDGSVDDSYEQDADENEDYDLDENMVIMAERVQMDQGFECGAEPLDDIFGRPIIRKIGKNEVVFRSALDAVPELLFGVGSKELKDFEQPDDVLIANNIASSANGEEKSNMYMYGYKWIWEDRHDAVKEANIRTRLEEFKNGKLTSVKNIIHNLRDDKATKKNNQDMPISIFGWSYCGSSCQPCGSK